MKSFSRIQLIFILLLPVLLLVNACGKKWKETTEATMSYSINRSSTPGHLHFYSGTMRLTNLTFSGTRKRGGDVNFSNSPGATIDFSTGAVNPSMRYDIPQGTYTGISMQFRCDPLDSLNPAIYLVGKFVNNPNDTIPVYFQFDAAQIFSVQAQTPQGDREITLVEDRPATVDVTFDPSYWFATIPAGQLVAATRVPVNSVASIVISSNINSNIYQSMVTRVAESTKVVFR